MNELNRKSKFESDQSPICLENPQSWSKDNVKEWVKTINGLNPEQKELLSNILFENDIDGVELVKLNEDIIKNELMIVS